MAVINAIDTGKAMPRCHAGLTPFKVEVTLPVDTLDNADDAVLFLGPFDENAFLNDLKLRSTDLDGATALVFDISTADVDGVADTALISGSTVGQAGGVDELDATQTFPDVGGKYLIIDVTTAAGTPVAGSMTIWGSYAGGLAVMQADASA